jgi:hypothetical protein
VKIRIAPRPVLGDRSGDAPPPPPPPAQSITLTALSGLAATAGGSSLGFSVQVSNPVGLPLDFALETVSGPTATPTPSSSTWSLGDMNKAISATWAAAGTSVIRVRDANNAVSNSVSVTVAPAPSPTPPPPPAPTVAGTRDTQPLLFQPVEAALRPELYAGAGQWSPDADQGWGPTAKWVDYQAGWPWANLHGDWFDAALVSQGTTAWASAAAPQNVTAGATLGISMDVTAALQNVQANGRWCAFKLDGSAAPRSVCTALHTDTSKRPAIDVTYVGGSTATLACRIVAADGGSGSSPQTTAQTIQVPAFIEFDRPTLPVSSATMRLTAADLNWSGSPTDIKLLGILNPPRNVQPVTGTTGAASEAGYLDSGITSVSGILGAHRYVDSAAESDFLVVDLTKSFGSEVNYDPAIWGGASDTGKWPHTVQGKWFKGASFQSYSGPSFKTSSQLSAMGITPLVSGLGAMVVDMPAASPLPTPGQEVTNEGRLAADLHLMFPEATFGQGNRTLFVRYYEWISLSAVTPALRIPILSSGVIRFTDLSGKTGIGPEHVTSNGGVGGSSGGGYGWQMRDGYVYNDAGIGGPDANADIRGWHFYDFQGNNPVGHQYGSEQAAQWDRWGQMGGLGATVYVGRWVLIEKEITLNTINVGAGTYSADGVVRAWVDGRLVSELTGLVIRTAPLDTAAYSPSRLRPSRDLGHKGLWWNEFHGGQSENVVNRTVARTGLVWGTRRIGPMKMSPSWVQAMPLNTWAQVPAGNTLASLDVSTNPTYTPAGADWVGSGMAAGAFSWTGMCFDQASGIGYYPILGGHHDYGGNDTYKVVYGDTVVHSRLKLASGMLPGPAITAVDGNESTGVYSDGGLRTTHGYNNSVFVPGIGPVLVRQVGTYWNPLDVKQVWSMDPTTGAHSLRADYSALTALGSGEGGCDYDPVRDCVWAMGQGTSTMIQIDAMRTGAWTVTKRGAWDNWLKSGGHCKYVPTLDRLVLWPANNGAEVVEFNPATYATVNCATSGSFSAGLDLTHTDQPGAGMTWCDPLGCFLIWHNPSSNRTQISTLTPPATAGGTWVKGTLAVSGSNAITPSAARQSGTFGRLAYSRQLGGVLLNNGTTEPTYFFRIV